MPQTDPTPFPLSPADLETLAAHAAEADAQGRLLPAQLAVLHARGCLRPYLPRACGGAELPVPQALALLEAVAQADGSCGWFTTLCAGAGWFTGFLPPALSQQLADTPRLCLAGSGAVLGTAVREGEGWRLQGEWPHATGAPWATHFTLNARLGEGGEMRAFIVPASGVEVLPRWKAMGLRASGTQGFRVASVWAPQDHAFDIRPDAAQAPGALYRFPFAGFAYVTIAATLSGMARHFTALALPLAAARAPGLAWPQGLVDAMALARAACLDAVDRAWAQLSAGGLLDEAQAEGLRRVSLAWVEACREAVDRLYPLCGLRAADPGEELNRVWRDFHTGSQHALFMPR